MALLIIGIILHKILEVNIVVFTHYVYLIAQHFKNEFILSTKKKQKKTQIQIFIRKILNIGVLYSLYMKAIYSDRTNTFNVFNNI